MPESAMPAAGLGADRPPAGATPAATLGAAAALAAVVTSSCCAVPLALAMAGLGGAWVGEAAALAPYKPFFLAAGGLALAVAWAVFLRRRRAACVPSGACAAPPRRIGTVLVLIVATKLLVLAALWGYVDADVMEWLMRQRAS